MVEALYWLIILKLITDNKTLVKYSSKPTFFSSKSFYENLVAVRKIKETLNRPAYIGMCILDLSKTLMYDFTTIISKTSAMIKGNYHSQTLTVWLMKSKRRMFTKTSAIAHRFDNKQKAEFFKIDALQAWVRSCAVRKHNVILKNDLNTHLFSGRINRRPYLCW